MTVTTEKPSSFQPPALDPNLQVRDVLKTLPQECFQKNSFKAWSAVVINIAAVGLGYVWIAFSPWFLLPFAWLFTGTALTGSFVIGHDCGHRSFAKRRWVNDLVGHLMMLPLIYPFHSWRLLHDKHHLNTNKLGLDNAWEPWQEDAYHQANPVLKGFYQGIRGHFWWLGSIAHWAVLHFTPYRVAERDRSKMRFSIAVVVAFAIVFFPTLIWTTGIWGFVKFWLLPWMFYHFWMSTFTVVHHTDPQIPFKPIETWNEVESQLAGTVHCRYPWWVEFLCYDINVHIPHHLSVGIPSYNLRLAHASLKENWGSYLQERVFSWKLMNQIATECHLYDSEKAYKRFSETT
ncbi:MAG: fatty acid desaturase [Leptolyngbyaceae cyanobacterium bins.59]|nr:fatty acid desaturase [Leptolyngbyaceae cyanobacterium bins.59]